VFTADGTLLASGSQDRTVILWETKSGKKRATLGGYPGVVTGLAFTGDGKLLISGSGADDLKERKRGEIRVWDMATTRKLHSFPVHDLKVKALPLTPDGRTMATASYDKTVRVWEVATMKEQTRFPAVLSDPTFGLALTADGRNLAIGSADYDPTAIQWAGNITIREVGDGKILRTLTGHTHAITCVLFTANEKVLASASSDRTIRLWSVATGSECAILTGHRHYVWSIAATADGKTLASASIDGTVRIWACAIPNAS
jgi:WD40 repeat protein